MKQGDGYKISFCTVCMDRAYHLKQTLPQNIRNNLNYENIEFVLLDYNSSDDLEEWVKSNLMEYINNGKVKYYKTTEPSFFRMAHSKNMVGRLAEGEILCFVDADNFTGTDYAVYINDFFIKNPGTGFLTTITKERQLHTRDVLGRLCVLKKDFLEVEGFDEFMNKYGFDDYDIAHRLEFIGRKRFHFPSRKYLQAINHEDSERLKVILGKIKAVFVFYKSAFESEFLYLFNDQKFAYGSVLNVEMSKCQNLSNALNPTPDQPLLILKSSNWIEGSWSIDSDILTISSNKNKISRCNCIWEGNEIDSLKFPKEIFLRVKNQSLIEYALYLFSILPNYNKMMTNLKGEKVQVNDGSYGKGVVFKNFDYQTPIVLK